MIPCPHCGQPMPEPPTREANRRVLDRLKRMTPDEVFALSVAAGIHNHDGTLTANYRDDEDE